jgi:SAM-dependent methyltransferase
MRTKFSPENPFTRLTWAYGFETIFDGAVVLDYGCFDGEFIDKLTLAKRVTAVGVDKNRDVVLAYRGPHKVLPAEETIPFPEGHFDIVTMFDVLEHIYDQSATLQEIHRVIKPGGRLVVTVPRRHFFTFLDHGNLKYLFPHIHKFWYTYRHSLADYKYRYLDNPYGLYGDVEKAKAWHQHFTENELVGLLVRSGFQVDDIDAYGLFGDVFNSIAALGLNFLIPERTRVWDNERFESRYFCCLFVKP